MYTQRWWPQVASWVSVCACARVEAATSRPQSAPLSSSAAWTSRPHLNLSFVRWRNHRTAQSCALPRDAGLSKCHAHRRGQLSRERSLLTPTAGRTLRPAAGDAPPAPPSEELQLQLWRTLRPVQVRQVKSNAHRWTDEDEDAETVAKSRQFPSVPSTPGIKRRHSLALKCEWSCATAKAASAQGPLPRVSRDRSECRWRSTSRWLRVSRGGEPSLQQRSPGDALVNAGAMSRRKQGNPQHLSRRETTGESSHRAPEPEAFTGERRSQPDGGTGGAKVCPSVRLWASVLTNWLQRGLKHQ